jgi:hypothetical protein
MIFLLVELWVCQVGSRASMRAQRDGMPRRRGDLVAEAPIVTMTLLAVKGTGFRGWLLRTCVLFAIDSA